MRKPLMAGNWKMYKTAAETSAFFATFNPQVASASDRDIALFPTFVNLPAAIEATAGTGTGIGGQNLYWANEGAFTGEISAPMLRAVGCRYVLVGHSERRQYFGETDETVLKRTLAALEGGLTPIVCVGERLAEREAEKTNEVLDEQFRGGISGLSKEQFEQIVIAYEPVWAIGTGKTATPEIAEDAHQAIRKNIEKAYGAEGAGKARILYGGSVKPDNIKGLMAKENIDGVLVGGASLDPASFAAIVNY
jgi:triosephosphate isomerase